MGAKLTEMQVLSAVTRAVAPFSFYIGDVIQGDHWQRVRDGSIGHTPRVGLILARLRGLEARGLLKRSALPNGNYGYEWRITDAGRAALLRREG